MANAPTAVRLALILPAAAAFAQPELFAPVVVALLLCVAIASAAAISRRASRQCHRTKSNAKALGHALRALEERGPVDGVRIESVAKRRPASCGVCFGSASAKLAA